MPAGTHSDSGYALSAPDGGLTSILKGNARWDRLRDTNEERKVLLLGTIELQKPSIQNTDEAPTVCNMAYSSLACHRLTGLGPT